MKTYQPIGHIEPGTKTLASGMMRCVQTRELYLKPPTEWIPGPQTELERYADDLAQWFPMIADIMPADQWAAMSVWEQREWALEQLTRALVKIQTLE